MKNLAFILSVFVLLMATIPCCLADNCSDEKAAMEQTTDSNREQSAADTDCGLCSPFYRCHTCPGFALTPTSLQVSSILQIAIKCYITFSQNFISSFTAFIWQPPKIS